MPKPVVLHIGEPIKYNHEFYEKDFLSRFDVVRNEDLDRQSFVQALKDKKCERMLSIVSSGLANNNQIWRLLSHLPPTFPDWWRNGPMGL